MEYKEIVIRERGTKKKTYEYSFEGRPDIQIKNGISIPKRTRISKGGFRTKTEAKQAGRQHMIQYYQGGAADQTLTIAQLAQKYMVYCSEVKKLKHTTLKNYQVALNLLCDQLGSCKLKDVKKTHAQDIAIIIQNRDDCEKTLNQYLDNIRRMFDYAVKFEYLPSNPFVIIDTLKSNKQGNPHKTLTKQQMQTILDAYKEDCVLYPFIMIAYHCGLRLAEVCGLTWNDVDFENKTITIEKQLEVRKDGLYFVSPKYNSVGVVTIDDVLCNYLIDFKNSKERKTYSRDKNGKIIVGKDFSFVLTLVSNGNPVTDRRVHRMLEDKKVQGYPAFTPHDLRHTHCTELISNGFSIKYVQERLRHKDPQTTMRVYAKLTAETKRTEDEKLNNLF